MAGSAWPCRVTHQLLIASIRRRPSLSSSSLPRAERTCSGSGLLATWVVGCQRWGCQVTGSGFKVINEAHRKSPDQGIVSSLPPTGRVSCVAHLPGRGAHAQRFPCCDSVAQSQQLGFLFWQFIEQLKPPGHC